MNKNSDILASFGVELDDLQDWEKFEMFTTDNAIVIRLRATPDGLPPVEVERMVSLQELNAIKEEVLPIALLTIIKETRDKFRILTDAYTGNDDEN